jgi:hypothetical protein
MRGLALGILEAQEEVVVGQLMIKMWWCWMMVTLMTVC